MKKTYYKVVKQEDGRRVSIWATGFAMIEYPPKALVEANPMSAGIFVFTEEKHARSFSYKCNIKENSPIIIKCYGIGPIRRFKTVVDSYKDLIVDWFYTKSWGPTTPKQEVPLGTVCFNAVQLLE